MHLAFTRGDRPHAANAIIAEEISAAKERVATRVQQSVDEIALNILRNYRVFEDRHELHIVVSKELTKS